MNRTNQQPSAEHLRKMLVEATLEGRPIPVDDYIYEVCARPEEYDQSLRKELIDHIKEYYPTILGSNIHSSISPRTSDSDIADAIAVLVAEVWGFDGMVFSLAYSDKNKPELVSRAEEKKIPYAEFARLVKEYRHKLGASERAERLLQANQDILVSYYLSSESFTPGDFDHCIDLLGENPDATFLVPVMQCLRRLNLPEDELYDMFGSGVSKGDILIRPKSCHKLALTHMAERGFAQIFIGLADDYIGKYKTPLKQFVADQIATALIRFCEADDQLEPLFYRHKRQKLLSKVSEEKKKPLALLILSRSEGGELNRDYVKTLIECIEPDSERLQAVLAASDSRKVLSAFLDTPYRAQAIERMIDAGLSSTQWLIEKAQEDESLRRRICARFAIMMVNGEMNTAEISSISKFFGHDGLRKTFEDYWDAGHLAFPDSIFDIRLQNRIFTSYIVHGGKNVALAITKLDFSETGILEGKSICEEATLISTYLADDNSAELVWDQVAKAFPKFLDPRSELERFNDSAIFRSLASNALKEFDEAEDRKKAARKQEAEARKQKAAEAKAKKAAAAAAKKAKREAEMTRLFDLYLESDDDHDIDHLRKFAEIPCLRDRAIKQLENHSQYLFEEIMRVNKSRK